MENQNNARNTYNILKTVNTFSLIIVTIIDIILFFGYISDYKQGHISFLFMFMVQCVVIISMICSYIVYLRKKDSPYFKHVSIIGYIAVYALAVFGAQNDMVFIMIFPISIIYILYFDYALILKASIVFALINVGDVIYYVLFLKHMHSGAPLNSTSILLQAACVIMYLVVLCQTTRISNRNNSIKINNINDEKEKSAQLLLDVLSIVDAVKENCTTAETYIRSLGQDVETTTTTLNQIAEANSTNAQSIDKQTGMTSNIQEMIYSTKEMADQMLALAHQSETAVQGGQEAARCLQAQSRENIAANQQVVSSVSDLIENAKAVEDITEQIFSISSQTNLLALNASIESARAGEAGRGFAVVAEQIRQLADETRKLTEMIQHIVENLRNNADAAKTTVDEVVEHVNAQQDLINNASTQFTGIGTHMTQLNQTIQNTYSKIEEILQSNNMIVDSINQISSVSQEVAASTQQVVALGENTRDAAQNAEKLMSELTQTVKMVDKYL